MAISEHARDRLRRLESAVGAIAIALATIGIVLLPLTTPLFVRGLVTVVGSDELTGLSAERTLEVAEAVRVFVTHAEAPALPAEVDGRAGFDAAAISHLEDVRDVMVPARSLALGLAALAIVWVVLRSRTRAGRITAAFGVFAAGVLLLSGSAVLLLSGIVNFNGLFAWFHSLFFAAGTWTFPADALMIQVFPLPFWIVAGACWGALIIAAGVGLVWGGRRLMFTKPTVGV